jgi:hypothetical protein
MARETIAQLWDFFCDLERRIEYFDKKIEAAPNTAVGHLVLEPA